MRELDNRIATSCDRETSIVALGSLLVYLSRCLPLMGRDSPVYVHCQTDVRHLQYIQRMNSGCPEEGMKYDLCNC